MMGPTYVCSPFFVSASHGNGLQFHSSHNGDSHFRCWKSSRVYRCAYWTTSSFFGQFESHRREMLSETKLTDLLHGSEYALTYEDKDGDLMLVGDVPWEWKASRSPS